MSKSIYDRVAEAAESLVARGLKPTMAAVRDELGGGSLRDISPALRKWRDKAEQSSSETTPIPPELMAVLQRSSQALWSAAESRANELLSAFRAKSDFPPLYFLAADTEIMLDDAVWAARRAQRAGVETRLDIWPMLPHVFPLFARWFPEARRARQDIAAFLEQQLRAAAVTRSGTEFRPKLAA